jgi:hypothetical protein
MGSYQRRCHGCVQCRPAGGAGLQCRQGVVVKHQGIVKPAGHQFAQPVGIGVLEHQHAAWVHVTAIAHQFAYVHHGGAIKMRCDQHEQ